MIMSMIRSVHPSGNRAALRCATPAATGRCRVARMLSTKSLFLEHWFGAILLDHWTP